MKTTLRLCKCCGHAPRFNYYTWKAAPPVVELQCGNERCPDRPATHSYSEAVTCVTWNAMNLPDEKKT